MPIPLLPLAILLAIVLGASSLKRLKGFISSQSLPQKPDSGRVLAFALHLVIVLAFVFATRVWSKRSSLQASPDALKEEETKAAPDRPAPALRDAHPLAYDKACRAIKKFESCESSFLEDKRHRTRIYYNAIEQSGRCMKHLYRLKRALPNDLIADMRLDYFTDYIEDAMSRSLRAMSGQLKDGMHHFHASRSLPLPSNAK